MLTPKEENHQVEHEKEKQRLEPNKPETLPHNSVCCFLVQCDQSGTGKSWGRSMSVALKSVVPRPAKVAAASPGNLIQLQILRPNQRPMSQKLGRRGTQQSVF